MSQTRAGSVSAALTYLPQAGPKPVSGVPTTSGMTDPSFLSVSSRTTYIVWKIHKSGLRTLPRLHPTIRLEAFSRATAILLPYYKWFTISRWTCIPAALSVMAEAAAASAASPSTTRTGPTCALQPQTFRSIWITAAASHYTTSILSSVLLSELSTVLQSTISWTIFE